MRQLNAVRDTVQTWRQLEKKIVELSDMATLALGENDQSLQEEIQREAEELTSQLDKLEFQLIKL